MSRPNIVRGTYVTVLMGNGASPEVFTALCGITTKSIEDTVNTTDSFTRDCTDPEEISTRNIVATSRQWTLTGGGQMNRDQFQLLEDAVGVVQNYRFAIARKSTEVAPVLNGYYAGAAMITRKRITGDDGTFVGIDVTIESDGPWAWVDV
jgi:hypothetical protein